MYSHLSTPVFVIQATDALSSSLAMRGSPSRDMHNENVVKNLELHQLNRSLQLFSKNTSSPQPIQQNNEVNNILPTFHHLSSNSCPTVHIVMIIVSYNESRSSFLAIKSILMYRQAKLHFHFITDSTAQVILKPMMSSWLLPGVEFDFYNITEAWSTTPWSNNQLCSKELLKITALHLVLPHEIDAVVVVDPNLIITASVFEMFYQTLMDLGQKGRLIALSSSECTIECNSGSVIQRNTRNISHSTQGVMVLNLAGMRSLVSWRNVWEAIRHEPPDCKQVSSVISMDIVREVCATLRCDWNTYDNCWANISVFEQELKSNTLKGILQPIQDYDGYQLRFKEKENCYESDPKLKKPSSSAIKRDKCIMLKWEGTVKRRMYPYFLGYKYTTSDSHDVTLVSHSTLDRLYLVETASKHWNGPMSIAIEVTDSQVQEVIDFVSKSELLLQRKNIAYHLLFKIGFSYPINPMRVLAHKFVTTPYVLFTDVDFIPSYDLYENLKNIFKNMKSMKKMALVVPAFECYNPEMNFPKNKQELLDLMKKELVRPFHWRYRLGHGPTNYNKWKQSTTTSPYTVSWGPSYEPYMAAKTSIVPYDPRFVSRQHNKESHSEELHMAGYQLMVMHNGFLLHMPHPPYNISILYNYQCYVNRYHEWKQEKIKQYRKH